VSGEAGGRAGAKIVVSGRDIALRRRYATVALALLFLAVAAVPAWLGLTGRPWPATVSGLLVSGASAVGTGLGVLVWWGLARRRGRADTWRALFALAMTVWGLGQLTLFGEAYQGSLSYPALGDNISSVAGPLSVIALLVIPRTSMSSWPGLRLALDAFVVGFAGALALRSAFMTTPSARTLTDGYVTTLYLVLDVSVLALVLLAAVRDVRSRLLPGVLGIGCHVFADVVGIYAAADGARDLPWYAGVVWCLGWPLFGIAIVIHEPRQPDVAHGAEHDRREALAAHVATVLSAILITATLVADRQALSAPGTALLLGIAIAVLAVRELIGALLRQQLTAGLRVQAYRDPLTGMANRRAITARLSLIDDRRAWVVLTLDLDGFKRVNDLLGHHAGDDLLVGVAEAIRRVCPPDGLAARLGGDEFAVLSPGDLTSGAELGERLRLAVGAVLARHAPGLETSTSVGVGRLVTFPREGGCPEQEAATAAGGGVRPEDRLTALVESAAALRAAKARGRDQVAVYSGDVAAARERRLRVEQRLRRAVATGELTTHAQPLVSLTTGALCGFEALARWTDAELGPVSPGEFVPVAEQTGLIVTLGEQLLDATLVGAVAAGVFDAGLRVAINVSPIQLRVPGFVETVRDRLARHRVPPSALVIEVTEAILVADDDPALRTLDELAVLGVPIAIDDFGTGYSALGYLRRLPVQTLKVDRSLTTGLRDAKTLAIVEAAIKMAHRIGIGVVTEGIEDEETANACRELGADIGQGWHFGRPVTWTDAAALLAAPVRAGGVPVPRG
jgi:diguanylate cyclase (GGDEF)-like protein